MFKKKLVLKKETVLPLNPDQAGQVEGAGRYTDRWPNSCNSGNAPCHVV